jgi:hypothetical protein
MDIYDAYYNGTVTMIFEPDPSNATTAACAKFESQPIEDAYLRIGPRSRNGTDRSAYDTNDLYLSIGRSFEPKHCPFTPHSLFFAVESSSSLTYHGTAWDLNATKSNDGFDIKGSMNSRRAYYNNHYNYEVNSTDPGYAEEAVGSNFTCPTSFFTQALTSLYFPTLSGSVTASEGNVAWGFVDYYYGYKVTATFTGAAWKKGAQLDTTGQAVATTGEAKRYSGPVQESFMSFMSRNLKWIIPVVVVIVLLALGYCAFKCVRRSKRRKQAKVVKMQQYPREPVWQQ